MSSQERVLDIWKRLTTDGKIHAAQLALEYGRDIETIKRDIGHIRTVFGNVVDYQYETNEYRLTSNETNLTLGQAFILLLMVYNSRAFNREECQQVIQGIMDRFSKQEQGRLKRFFRSFQYHYEEVTTRQILDHIQILFEQIFHQQKVQFHYPSWETPSESVIRVVSPITLTYHRGTFFLLAKRETDSLRHYRVDRMANLKPLDVKFQVDLGRDFFQAGQYHNRSFNMFAGEEKVIRMRIPINVEEYLRRECPDVRVIRMDQDTQQMEVEVTTLGYSGILFWIFSQQDWIEVLFPLELRQIILKKVEKMKEMYSS